MKSSGTTSAIGSRLNLPPAPPFYMRCLGLPRHELLAEDRSQLLPSPDFAVRTDQRHRSATTGSGSFNKMSWQGGASFGSPSGQQQHHHSPQQTISPTATHHSPHASVTTTDDGAGRKRKRSSFADDLDGTASPGDDGNGLQSSPTPGSKARHHPGVKRACNDCRQQKVRYQCVTHLPALRCERVTTRIWPWTGPSMQVVLALSLAGLVAVEVPLEGRARSGNAPADAADSFDATSSLVPRASSSRARDVSSTSCTAPSTTTSSDWGSVLSTRRWSRSWTPASRNWPSMRPWV